MRWHQNGGPKFNSSSDQDEWRQLRETTQEKVSWEDLDLAAVESKVFLLGVWKNFQELEENISIPELESIFATINEKDYEDKKFSAALKGVDLDANRENTKTFEDVRREALGDNPKTNDIVNLKGRLAQETGFGVGKGLMYEVWDN